MSTNAQTLWQITGVAYRERVINHQAPEGAYALFGELVAADPDFLTYARAELARLEAVPASQCFASSRAAEFLRAAIGRVEDAT